MKHFFFYSIFVFSISHSCVESSSKTKTIRIATAANMEFVMDSLVFLYQKETGTQCELIIGSSGKLTAQILAGAPYDVFISANMKYPQEIYDKGLAVNPPKVYALGSLVLWSITDKQPMLEKINNTSVKHIALANPENAPYGTAALEVLKKQNFYNEIRTKLVFGESVSQTNQFVLSASAEYGFTAKSVVLSPEMIHTGNWISIDDNLYNPIKQGVVVIKHQNRDVSDAIEFQDFLFSAKAQEIVRKYGYNQVIK